VATIDITKTELVWPGKYNEDGTRKDVPRVSLPFQVIETVNESRATREARKGGVQGTLFDVYEGKEGDTFEAGWRNKLIWGDNLLVMGSLLEKFAGKIDLIYIDPPFATGTDFSFKTEIGEAQYVVGKEQSIIEEKAYRDTWGRGIDSYVDMIASRLTVMRDLLSDHGNILVHCDWHVGHHIQGIMEEIFGKENFKNQIIWYYANKLPTGGDLFDRHHDLILWFGRSKKHVFNEIRVESEYKGTQLQTKKIDGVRTPVIDPQTGKQVRVMSSDKPCGDVWRLNMIHAQSGERVGYRTQKPEELLERIITACSVKGALVADFFVGSGTTLAVAEKLGRRWIGCDLGRWGTHVTRKRLLGIENCRPFEILNLGKYERQYWQGTTFGKSKDLTEQVLYEYLAFILRLYSAQPVAGLAHLHGKKGKALVHVGAVDAPVTISEIDAAVDECARLKQSELHVLGWEWEMGLQDLVVDVAKKKGVKLVLLIIPREVMEQQTVASGDVRFFELAYLEAEIKQPKKLTARVVLKDFVMSNAELIPEDVRRKVKKWSDYVDYWAVDWDFQNDTFMQGWVAYRTRNERILPLTCDPHTYQKAGKYRILVKVIDIFGNDTSQAFSVEVK
jgi:DNA modification methylase